MNACRPDNVSAIGGQGARRCPRRKLALAITVFCSMLAVFPALAQSPPATMETPLRDPWVSPDLRKPAPTPAPQGAALRAQVERKVKVGFDAADVNRSGTLTREQARAAGLGYVAKHFDEIDQKRAGAVSFDDVKRFLRSRGAQLD